jgi:uncharacterized protein (DUF433 family)
MFKLTLITVEDIMGNYYNNTTIAFGKSPHGQRVNRGGHPEGYGGTPVICGERLEKDGKTIKQIWG